MEVAAEFEVGRPRRVGLLVQDGRDLYFRYDGDWLAEGFNVSPHHLRFDGSLQGATTAVFGGLHGVFADSLPEGWGRLLTDRALRRAGVSPAGVTELRRLSFIGDRGPGALTYRPLEYVDLVPMVVADLDALDREAAAVLRGDDIDVDRLAGLGGSSGGARPKILVGLNEGTGALCADAAVLPKGYQHYIIKFRGATDRADAAEVELAYARMATAAGIETAPSRLLSSASGRQYFATRRFDRARGRRLHMLSAAGYLHDNFRLPAIDYGHLMDAANVLTGTRTEAAKVLRLAAFNVLAHNRDDHSKNFAFLADERGRWRFAPAYDLTFSPSAHGEHSITVAGEGRAPGRTQLLALAEAFDIKTGEAIVEEVAAAVAQWPKWATEAGVGRESREEIGGVLKVGR